MKGAFNLGKIAGIKISIHWTFSLLLLFIIINNYREGQSAIQILWSVLFILSIFVTVFLHELGHALAAKRFNIQTKDITLLPIGGLARLEKIPEKPAEEFIVAIAGPLVNLTIAFITYFFIAIPTVDELTKELSGGIGKNNFVLNFFIVNIWLSVFNLIPAFPMDGGRVFRAILTRFMVRTKATAIAARTGQLIALGFIVLGFYSNPFLIFIGLFIILGAQTELNMVKTHHLLKGNTIREIVMKKYETLDSNDTITIAIEKLLNGTAKSFLVLQNQTPAGTVTRSEIIKALSEKGKDIPVSDIMNKQLLSFNAEEIIEDVYKKLSETGREIAIVTQNHQLIGVVDLENILEYIMVKNATIK